MKKKRKLSLSGRLVLGIAVLSVLGLAVMFLIVSTVVRGLFYENALEIAQRDKIIYAAEIDGWFSNAAQTVHSLAASLSAVGEVERFPAVAEGFVADFDFVENVFIGFGDGSVMNGMGWRPDTDPYFGYVGRELDGVGWGPWEHWDVFGRPWFEVLYDKDFEPGVVAVTEPYLSITSGKMTTALAVWVPELGGVGASVGFSMSIGTAVDVARNMPVVAGGYIMLIGAAGEIVYHPSPDYLPDADGNLQQLAAIHNGEFFMQKIADNISISEFDDCHLGASHLIVTPLDTVGWSLVAVLPTEITLEPVMRSVAFILVTFAVFLIVLFVTVIAFVSLFTRSMEDSRAVAERFRALIDAMPMICAIFDEGGTPLFVNYAAVDFLELQDKEEYLHNFKALTPEIQPNGKASAEIIRHDFSKATRTGRVIVNPYWMHLTKNGHPLPVEVTIVPVEMEGEPRIFTYGRDLRAYFKIMELQEEDRQKTITAEVAEASNRAKSRFLAGMSHEIRTPITAVMGIAEIELQRPSLTPHLEEVFTRIYNSSGTLIEIINDILDLSKIEAGKMEILPEKYYTPSLVTNVAHLFTAYMADKNIEFKISVDKDLPLRLVGDVLRIGQILNNLLSNAFKYTAKGYVELSLHHENLVKDRTTLVIRVKDTGMGMTKHQLSILHRDYTQFHMHETGISGTGLGMSIVWSFVQMMNAEINVESAVGEGTAVTVRIPQQVAGTQVVGEKIARELQELKIKKEKPVFAPEPMPYGRVLVVDDIEGNLYVTAGLLKFYEIIPDTCDSGEKALEKIERGNIYDIIFMDQTMPGMSGTEAMHKIRALGYSGPIVALTANALKGQAEEFIRAGFDGFISKPINTKELNAALEKFVRDKQPPEVLAATAEAAAARAAAREAAGALAGALAPAGIGIESFQSDPALLRKLRADFALAHTDNFAGLTRALEENDIPTARRIAHNYKNLAGLIHEAELLKRAEYVERSLAKTGNAAGLDALEAELSRVMADIEKDGVTGPGPGGVSMGGAVDKHAALKFFKKIIPILQSKNAEALDMLGDLRKFPETAIIAAQIENFDFAAAVVNLRLLSRWYQGLPD